jgi:hypothetical protein
MYLRVREIFSMAADYVPFHRFNERDVLSDARAA